MDGGLLQQRDGEVNNLLDRIDDLEVAVRSLSEQVVTNGGAATLAAVVVNGRVTGNTLSCNDTASNPSLLPSTANVYLNGSKLIVQYDDSGTTRYKYLELTGTSVTWVHTTSAP